jgi:DNA-directed RNA polymerase II subunit RPB1
VDVTDPAGGFLLGVLQVGIDDSSLERQARLDEEYAQLLEDRRILRGGHPTAFPTICQSTYNALYKMPPGSFTSTGASQVTSIPYISSTLIVVRNDPIGGECQASATLNFCMHFRASFATRRVLEKYHLTHEAFDWVLPW